MRYFNYLKKKQKKNVDVEVRKIAKIQAEEYFKNSKQEDLKECSIE